MSALTCIWRASSPLNPTQYHTACAAPGVDAGNAIAYLLESVHPMRIERGQRRPVGWV